jgi:hypothetical protein
MLSDDGDAALEVLPNGCGIIDTTHSAVDKIKFMNPESSNSVSPQTEIGGIFREYFDVTEYQYGMSIKWENW